MGRSSVFSLEQIYRKQVVGTWSKIPEVFRYVNSLASTSPAGTDFGYFMGGAVESYNPSANFSDVDRLDFSNDTADMVSKAFLTIGKGYMRGFSSLTHGYTAGGYAPSISAVVSTIDRIDYADDTAAQTAKGPLETALSGNIVGFHNTDYGYSVGGYNPSISAIVSLNQRLEFANDTTTTAPKGNLGTAKSYGAGSGNQSYGYYSGGGTPSRVSTVERLDYSSDTSTLAPKGPLSRVVNEHDAAGNADYGYHAGGWDPSSPYSNVTDRIDYASDTSTALVKAILAYPGKHGPTTTGNADYGYWTGGYGNTTNSYRLDYSSDTTQMSIKGKRTRFSQNGAGVSSRANAMPLTSSTAIVPATRIETGTLPVGIDFGYFGGGHPGPTSTVDRIDFSNDTETASTKGPLSLARRVLAGTGNVSFGYFGGGYGASQVSTIDRIDYSNDTPTLGVRGLLSSAKGGTAAAGNPAFGYFSGGKDTAITTVDRIDYSNDTATAAVKGSLNIPRSYHAAAGNLNYGYHGGGRDYSNPSPSAVSLVDRIDYSNDTPTASPKGPLSLARLSFGATGNASYGYWGGGQDGNYFSTVDRIDYSNDTPTASPKGPLSSNRRGTAATGNTSYGYFAGGTFGPVSTIDRVDYSNDTATAAVKGPLSSGRYLASGTGPRINGLTKSVTVDKGADGYQTGGSIGPAFGYFASARPAGPSVFYTMIDRVDYSNDTPNMVQKGSMITTKYDYGSVASLSHGYMAAGFRVNGTDPNTELSSVERSDFSNDTATTVAKGPLTRAATGMKGAGNTSYGWMMGEYIVKSTVDRIDYSNDTATALVRGNLGMNQAAHGAAGNANYGYNAGGFGGPSTTRMSNVNRFDYSNDTANGVEKGPLTYATYDNAGVGNADFGYFMGGGNPSPYVFYSKVDRVDYSNDTVTASTRGSLGGPSTRGYMGTAGNPGAGYVGGGTPGPTTSRVDKIDYSNDTATATAKGSLTAARYAIGGFSGQDNGMVSPLVYIPRIRWVDSASEGTPITQGPAFGYFGGGSYPSVSNYSSSVDRIDYGNDTAIAAPKGNLSRTTQNHGGASSRTGGYYFGRFPAVSTVDRIDFDNDTATATAKGNLTLARGYTASTGNNDFGYTGGGYTGSPVSTIDRLDYSNDTTNTVEKGPLSVARYGLAATGNQSFGYIVGGLGKSTVDRVDYSSDTGTATPKGPLSAGIRYMTATGNANFGYVSRGYSPSFATFIYRIDYSNDTATTSVRGPLAAGASYRGATSSSDFGYFSGGQRPGSAVRSEISRIDYSNDTATAALKGNLSIAKNKHAGTSSRSHGLPSPQPTIAAPVQPPFPYPVQLPAPAPGHGYWSGGLNNTSPSNPATSEIGRIDFSNDTATTVLKGNMYIGRANHSVIGNSTYAYTGGGANPSEASPAYLSSIERMTYANDTATSVDKSTFREAFTLAPSPGQGANMAVAVGNQSYGYWGGQSGYVDRLDYSNDTAQAAAKTSQTVTKNGRAALGNLSYGYMCGGWISISTIDRIDYGNDTATMSPKGNLSTALAQTFGIGNSNYGYIITGRSPSLPTYRTSVERVDYANDTDTASPKGPLAGTTYKGAGTGDASYGYVIKGQDNAPSFGYHSTIFRIDYSNDTATAPSVSNFSHPGRSMRGFSGKAYGLPN